jgi:mannosyltransferase OCH1-like enzyme
MEGRAPIPRLIHQIWLGPTAPPDAERGWRESWSTHHPEWEVHLWTEESIPADLRRSEVYERLRLPAERADILRLELLWRFGGVYVDTDFECLRPLDPLLDGVELFLGDLKPGRTNNAIIGAVPEHPLLDRALDELRPAEWHGTDPKGGTGPHFLDAVIRPHRKQLKIFPPPVFYPSTEAEREAAHAIHHAARSWLDEEGLRYRLAKAEQRVEEAERERDALRARGSGGTRLRRLLGR